MRITRRYAWLFITILLTPVFLKSQELEKLRSLLEEKRMEEIAVLLPTAVEVYPDDPLILYLQAMFEPDGKKAIRSYESLFEKYRNSDYADDALMKISQYYFARGLYSTAKKYFNIFSQNFPSSPYADAARYLMIQSLLAEGESEMAREQLLSFSKEYPESRYLSLVTNDLKNIFSITEARQKVTEDNLPDSQPIQIIYTVQVGAFRNRENASRQNEDLIKMGYGSFMKTKQRNEGFFYIVYIGKFTDKKQAEEFGARFYDKYGIPYRIVEF